MGKKGKNKIRQSAVASQPTTPPLATTKPLVQHEKNLLLEFLSKNPGLLLQTGIAMALLVSSVIDNFHNNTEPETELTTSEQSTSNELAKTDTYPIQTVIEIIASEIGNNTALMTKIANLTASNYNGSQTSLNGSALVGMGLNQTLTLMTQVPELRSIIERCVDELGDHWQDVALSALGLAGSFARTASSFIDSSSESGNEIYRIAGGAYNAKPIMNAHSFVQLAILVATVASGVKSNDWRLTSLYSAVGFAASVATGWMDYASKTKLTEQAPKLEEIDAYQLTNDLKQYLSEILIYKDSEMRRKTDNLTEDAKLPPGLYPNSANPTTINARLLKLQTDYADKYNQEVTKLVDRNLKKASADFNSSQKLLTMCEKLEEETLPDAAKPFIRQIKEALKWYLQGEEKIRSDFIDIAKNKLIEWNKKIEDRVQYIKREITSYQDGELTNIRESLDDKVKNISKRVLDSVHTQGMNSTTRNETLEHTSQAIIKAINELKEKPINDTKRDELSKKVKKLTGLKELRKDHPFTPPTSQATDITELQELFSRYDAIHESRIQQLEKLNEILGTTLTKQNILEADLIPPINKAYFQDLCDSVEERDIVLNTISNDIQEEFALTNREFVQISDFAQSIKTTSSNPIVDTIIGNAFPTQTISSP